MKRRRFLSLAAAFACAPRFVQAGSWQGRALGAEVLVTLHGPRAEVNAALAMLPEALDRIEALFSLYRADSLLVRLNRGEVLDLPGPFLDILRQVNDAHVLSSGLFDPTVQPLWRALAEGGDTGLARGLIGWDKVRFDGVGLRLAPGQQLTLNGIAQGFATDTIRDALRARGFDRALIDIGEHAAIGGPFRLALEDPDFGLMGQRSLSDSTMATSSPGALRLGNAGHILGPRGEVPLWSTVSVEGPSATLADALSTAAVFMPRERLSRLKSEAGLSRITLVDHGGNLGTI